MHCRGVIQPAEKRTAPEGFIYDTIIIGAGYAGLVAARDLAERGSYYFRIASGTSA